MERDKMEELATKLACDILKAEPEVKKILWFPHGEELRVVRILDNVEKSDRVMAFRFGPDVRGGIPVPTDIAVIRPDEEARIPLPADWCDWGNAVVMYAEQASQRMLRLAMRLAEAHVDSEPDIKRVLWFPNMNELRLVEVLPGTKESERVKASHFGKSVAYGLPVPMAVAKIRPEEEGKIPLPDDWDGWEHAELIWERIERVA